MGNPGLVERVGAGNQEQRARVDGARGQSIQRRRGVGRLVRKHFKIRHGQAGVSEHGQRGHREAVCRRGVRRGSVRRHVRRYEQDAIEAERAAGGVGDIEVTDVNRVEGAAEQADPHQATVASRLRATSRHMASMSAGRPSPVTEEIG